MNSQMKVALVIATYPPEPVVSAQMGRDLAVHLAQMGSHVTVLCPPPSRPIGADYSTLQPKASPLVRIEEGVEVVRLPSFTAPQSRLLPRMKESWSFGRHVCRYLKNCPADADQIYVNTWPLLSQALIARYCARRGVPLICHIMDLYPESLLPKLQGWSRKLVAAPLVALDRWSVHQAQHTVVLSESMRRAYLETRDLPPHKVTTILNWVDERRYSRLPGRAEACARYAVPKDKFSFLYLGNIGPVAGVELLIQSFHGADLPKAQLLIVGDGSSKAKCVELASSLQARNIHFISDPDAANVPVLQSLGHVCLLPMRRGAGATSIPSKLMAYLLSAKPVLATLDEDCDTARCIRDAGCGWIGEPWDARWLSAKMQEIAALSPEILAGMGQNGRNYGLKHFSRSEGVERLARLVLAPRRNAAAGIGCEEVEEASAVGAGTLS